MHQVLYIECGRANDLAVTQVGPEIDHCSISDLWRKNLLRYDVVIVPSYANEDFLKSNWSRFEEFLNLGGVLVALGSTQDKTSWIPYCVAHREFGRTADYVGKDTPEFRMIFADMPLDETSIKYHSEFVSHGVFQVDPTQAKVLLKDPDTGDAVMAILAPPGVAGRLFITTLDPDFHAIIGRTLPPHRWNPNAQKLLANIVSWAKKEAELKGRPMRTLRRLCGLSSLAASYIVLGAMSVTTLASATAYFVGHFGAEQLGVIGSMASIISLTATAYVSRRPS